MSPRHDSYQPTSRYYGVPKAKEKENISLPTFYMVIHFLCCISINIFKFLVDYLHAIHIFILHYNGHSFFVLHINKYIQISC